MAGEYYVYEHIDPYTGECLYVGMGKGSRAYMHKPETEAHAIMQGTSGRQADHGAHLRDLMNRGYVAQDWVALRLRGLSRAAAALIEAALIEDRGPLYNRLHNGRRKAQRPAVRLAGEKADDARALYAEVRNFREVARRLGCNAMSVHDLIKGPEYAARRHAGVLKKRRGPLLPPANDNTPEASQEVA